MKKILFSVSPTGWAYDLRCQALMKHLSSHFYIQKEDNEYLVRHGGEFDLVYASGFDTVAKRGAKCKSICTTIGGVVERSMDQILKIVSPAIAVVIPNLKWFEELKQRDLYPKLFYIPNGVSTEIFVPTKKTSPKFVVGWVGNDRIDRMKVKRVDQLRKACDRLHVPLLEQNWTHNNISHRFMPKFYRNIDLYVNCSTTEGSNNPILEACSSGVPVLATKVGNVPQLLESGVVPLRNDLRDLKEKIEFFRFMSLEERRVIGARLRKRMLSEFDWSKRALEYKTMFDYCLSIIEMCEDSI